MDDTANTDEGVAVDLHVLDNDSDGDNDTLTITEFTEPANGTLTDQGTYFTYQPNAGYSGIDTFTYTISDGKGGFDTAEVSITVSPATTETAIYVFDISFESTRRDRDWRAVFKIRSDSDGDGVAEATDAVAPGATITVTFAGNTYSGTTDINGEFRTGWIMNLRGTHVAEVTDLAFADYFWNKSLGEDDDDGDGLPDELFSR